MAARRLNTYGIALSMFLLMFLMVITPAIDEPNLTLKMCLKLVEDKEKVGYLTLIVQDILSRICLIIILHCLISISVKTATAGMDATAFVNGSNSATVRDNLDELFDGAPGGNNDWISTDEREAVREIGPMCIEDMETRMGLREGMPHRTNSSVDWNDLEFVEEGIAPDEVDLIAANHPQERLYKLGRIPRLP